MGQIFVYLVTGLGGVGALFRPIYGLCAYILLAVIRPETAWRYTIEPGYYSRIVGIGLLIGWAIHGFGGFQFGKAKIPAAALGAFWVWSLVSSLAAQFQIEPWIFMGNLTKIVIPVLIGITLIKTKRDLQLVTWTLALSSTFLAIRENETFLLYGVGPGDNQTAHTMAAMVGFLFCLALGTRAWLFRGLFLAGSLAAAHAVMFHMSRGAMLGVAVSVFLILVVTPKTPLFYAMLVCVVLAGMRLAGPQVIEEFFTTFKDAEARDLSAIGRTMFWKAMAQATLDNPLFGVGPHNWPTVSFFYGIPGREGHGAWQQLAAETGFPGIAFILLYYGYLAFRLLPLAMRSHRLEYDDLQPFAQMYITSMGCWLACQVFGSFYLVEFPYYCALMGAGVLKVRQSAPDDAHHIEDWDDERHSEDLSYAGDELHAPGQSIS